MTPHKLTLKKTVINDNGGDNGASEWTLTATGTNGFSGTGTPNNDDSMATKRSKQCKLLMCCMDYLNQTVLQVTLLQTTVYGQLCGTP